MKHRKIIVISFGIAAMYIIISLVYFFGAFMNTASDSALRQAVERGIAYPAFMFFGAGFSSGTEAAYFALGRVFLITWAITLVLTYIFFLVLKYVRGEATPPDSI